MDYPYGPWKELFVGIYDDYSLRLLFNQDGLIISEILNKDKTKAVLSLTQIMGVFGDSEAFIESISKSAIYLNIHDNSNSKYLLLQSNQEILNYNVKDVNDFLNYQYKDLMRDLRNLQNISESYEINVKLYNELPNDLKTKIFSNPLNLFSFITKPKVTSSQKVKEEINKTLFLGFYRNNDEKVIEKIEQFSNTLIIGNNKLIFKTMIENFSINGINTVVFSDSKDIINMKYPNEDKNISNKNITPIGFPLKEKIIGEDIYVNLSELPLNSFLELNNIDDSNVADLINDIISNKKPKTLDNLIKELDEFKYNDKYNFYDVHLTIRILNIIKQKNPGIYLGDSSVSNLNKDNNNLGTINFIKLNKLDTDKIIIYNIIKKIVNNIDDRPVAIFVENLQDYFNNENDNITKDFYNLFNKKTQNYFIFSVLTEIDLPKEFSSNFSAKLSSVDDLDIGLNLKDSKPFRFILRPTLSK